MTIAALYLGDMGAPAPLRRPAPVRHAVGKMRITPTHPIARTMRTPTRIAPAARAAAAIAAHPARHFATGKSSGSSSSSSDGATSSSSSPSTDAGASASYGGGGSSGSSSDAFATTSSGGQDAPDDASAVPVKDAYVSVSGGIPDGALYAIMAAVAIAGGYILYRRSKGKR